LSGSLVAIVLFGALLHAGWNALVKSGADKDLDTALIHVLASAVALPMLLVAGLPPPVSWPYIAASLLIHIGYYTALVGAYRHGDLGLTYPIMRGAAPMLVAVGSTVFLGDNPTPVAWVGIVAITVGVALVGLSSPRAALRQRKAVAFALANAVIIALYTVTDGIGVRSTVAAGSGAASYVLLLFVLDGWPYALLVWSRRGGAGSAAVRLHARQRWSIALVGGLASIASYTIALWAMTRAPVSSVAALRETSVLFAALIGAVTLGERIGPQRAWGTAVVVAGVMALRLA
jgi:phosphonate utilization associated putative membrane protein